MRSLTGFLIFSFLFLLPFKVSSNIKEQDCSSGSTWCELCGNCQIGNNCDNCKPNMHTLEKKKGTVYSLPEGAVVKCENGSTLVPLTEMSYWICRSPEDVIPQKTP